MNNHNHTTDLHPPHRVHDGLINTWQRKIVDLERPTVEMINIEDIANALSKCCRWGCQIKPLFSVAQHSVLVSYLVPQHLRFAALMHDASEAYLGDVIKPLKVKLGKVYKEMEVNFMEVIAKKFRINFSDFIRIKPWDERAAEIEFNAFFKDLPQELERVFNRLDPVWSHDIAYEMFLSTFNEVRR